MQQHKFRTPRGQPDGFAATHVGGRRGVASPACV